MGQIFTGFNHSQEPGKYERTHIQYPIYNDTPGGKIGSIENIDFGSLVGFGYKTQEYNNADSLASYSEVIMAIHTLLNDLNTRIKKFEETVAVTGVSIDIEGGVLTLNAQNATRRIVPTITPSNATNTSVRWSTANPDVVTIDENGTVTAIGTGTTTISCTTIDGGFSASCAVSCSWDTSIHVTGLTLSTNTLAFTSTNSNQTLIATVSPSNATNKNVTWSSNNTNVATVNSSGLVTAVAPGDAIITCRTSDGGYTATCSVHCEWNTNVAVTGVSISPVTKTFTSAGSTQQLTATVSPSNATNKNVTWSSNNTNVATVNSSGLVTAVAPGDAIITCTTSDGSKTAQCNISCSWNLSWFSIGPDAITVDNYTTANNAQQATSYPSTYTSDSRQYIYCLIPNTKTIQFIEPALNAPIELYEQDINIAGHKVYKSSSKIMGTINIVVS